MALRRELLLIVVLLIAIVLLVKAVGFIKVNVVSADASAFVLEDLKVKYPNADIGILETKEMLNSNNEKYYEVKARVTTGLYTPCPVRVHIYYNYPVQNFVPQPADVITQNCAVCTEGTCTLNFPEEAIIASHTFKGTEAVASFISSQSASPSVQDAGNSWLVKWDSVSSPYYYNVVLDKGGNVLNVTKTNKES